MANQFVKIGENAKLVVVCSKLYLGFKCQLFCLRFEMALAVFRKDDLRLQTRKTIPYKELSPASYSLLQLKLNYESLKFSISAKAVPIGGQIEQQCEG